MKAEEKKIQDIFTNQNIFKIPNYQRPYSWNEDNVMELLNDIVEAYEEKMKEYFIGSIIVIDNNNSDFEVVDGQQRLTTITLIFATLRNIISKESAKSHIQSVILPINALTDEAELPRLVVRKQDEDFFNDYILLNKKRDERIELNETKERFVNNMQVITSFFEKFDEDYLMKITNFILQKVFVVLVKTDSFDSAYRLFNVLNARGLSLSNADLLKNLLFGKCKNDNEKERIEKLWDELEDLVKIKNLDLYLSHYRTAIKGNKAQVDLFKEYEEYFKTNPNISVENFCQNLISSAKNYLKIRDNTFEDNGVKKIINSLKNVSYDEWIPVLLSFLNNRVEDFEFKDFVTLIEKITYQNWIRRLGKTQRYTVYYNVINYINKGENKKVIIDKISEQANDDEFFNILNNDIYGMSYAKAVLLRIEEAMQDDSVSKQYSGTISIEHILPQKPTSKYWTTRFSDEDIFNSVHKIGNLVLLSGKKNSQAQNYDFDRKKEVYLKKNEKVSFDITKEICSKTEWNKDSINKRQQELLSTAKEIWALKK